MVETYKTEMDRSAYDANGSIDYLSILLVEDSEADAYAVERILKGDMPCPCDVVRASGLREAEALLKSGSQLDMILLDLGLPDSSSVEDTFSSIEPYKDAVPIIVLTSVNDHDIALELIGDGAQDFVKKSSVAREPMVLCRAIEFAVRRHRVKNEILKRKEAALEQKDSIIDWMSGGYSVNTRE